MIIDFRVRPPFKSYLTSVNYRTVNAKPNPDPTTQSIFAIGKGPVPGAQAGDINVFVQEMDDTETQTAVIMGRKADDNGEIDNNDIAELRDMFPGRFVAFAGVNPCLAGQIEEIERCAALGFKGVGLDAGWLRRPLLYTDPIFEPVYRRCEELGLICALTSSVMLGPTLEYSRPSQIMQVAMQHPKLKIVVPHASWPHVHEILAVAVRCPNVYLIPDCYVYIPGFPLSEEYVNAANGFLKYRMLYASTYPVRSLQQCKDGWMARNFTPEALKLNMYENAKRLLQL